MTAKQLAGSRERLSSFLAEMLPPLGRKDRQHWGGVSLRGLLLDGERKSVGGHGGAPAGRQRTESAAVRQSEPVGVGTPLATSGGSYRACLSTTSGLDRRRYGIPQERRAFSRCRPPVLGYAGQNGQLPNCGQPAPHGGTRQFAAGLPPVLAERMDRGSGALSGSRCPRGHRISAQLATGIESH